MLLDRPIYYNVGAVCFLVLDIFGGAIQCLYSPVTVSNVQLDEINVYLFCTTDGRLIKNKMHLDRLIGLKNNRPSHL